jgi:hypothetical protein
MFFVLLFQAEFAPIGTLFCLLVGSYGWIKEFKMKTKRFWSVLAFTVSSFLTIFGQETIFYAGGKVGIGMPSLATDSKSTPLNEGYALRLSYYGGFAFEIQSDKILGFRTEINYSQQGGKRQGMQAIQLSNQLKGFWDLLSSKGVKHDNYMYANLKSYAIYNYLEVPFLAKCTFGSGRVFNFYLTSGPFIGFLLDAKSITKGASSIYLDKEGTDPVDKYLQGEGLSVLGLQSFNNDIDITKNLNKVNFGWQGAIGFEIILKSGKLFMDFGGNYGFAPIQKDRSNGENITDNAVVTFGYLHQL